MPNGWQKKDENVEMKRKRDRKVAEAKARYDPACIQFNMPDFNLDIYLCIIFRHYENRKERGGGVNSTRRKPNSQIEKRLQTTH